MGQHAVATLNTFLAFHIIPSLVGLPALVTTFLISKTVKRHPTLINACLCWILSGNFSAMLLYAGQHTSPDPNETLCRAQASLMSGITPMWSVAILMLVYYVWSCAISKGIKPNRFATYMMIAVPYFTLGVWSISACVLTISGKTRVTRNLHFFYCSLPEEYAPFVNAMSLFTALLCFVITIMEIWIGVILYRNRNNIGRQGNTDIQFVVRILVFGLYVFMGIIFSLLSAWGKHTVVPDMFGATVGFAVMLIFGSQPDIWRLWCPWCFKPWRSMTSASPKSFHMKNQRDFHGKPVATDIQIEVSYLVV